MEAPLMPSSKMKCLVYWMDALTLHSDNWTLLHGAGFAVRCPSVRYLPCNTFLSPVSTKFRKGEYWITLRLSVFPSIRALLVRSVLKMDNNTEMCTGSKQPFLTDFVVFNATHDGGHLAQRVRIFLPIV